MVTIIKFADRQVEKILSGVKRVTRINIPCPWSVGETITACKTVSGNLQPFALLRIVAIKEHLLKDISDSDAKMEGYSDKSEFHKVWLELHPEANGDDRVWAIEYEMLKPVTTDDLSLMH